MFKKPFRGVSPRSVGRAYVAQNATLLGDVTLCENASIWPGAVLRGDCAAIRIGENSNLQDCVIVHADAGHPTVVEKNCLIGHRAILHSCELEEGVLVGMGATVMTGAKIGKGSVIGAGALITEGKMIPPGVLVVGVPGRVVRELTPEEMQKTIYECDIYRELAEEQLEPFEEEAT